MLHLLSEVESVPERTLVGRQHATMKSLLKRGLAVERWIPPPLGHDYGGSTRYSITKKGRAALGHGKRDDLLEVINKAAWHLENNRPDKALNELQKALRAQR
jgi:hypothetical protein